MTIVDHILTHINTRFSRKGLLFCFLILCAVCLLTYYPSLDNHFQQEWDDQWMLLENPFLFYPTWEAIGRSFFTFYHNQYSPLNQLYYLGIYHIAGFNPFAFHLGSVLVHMVNVILVFILIRRVMTVVNINWRSGITLYVPFLTALIFAIHPLQVESVAWISASKVIIYTTFTLLGILSYIGYKNHKRYLFLGMTFICYVASLMVKEQAVIFPLNILLIDFLYRAYGKGSLRLSVWIEKIPFFLLAFGYWYWSAQNQVGILDPANMYPWYDRIVFAGYSLLMYVFRFFVPVNLSHFYAYPMVSGETMPLYYYGYLILGLMFVIYLYDLYQSRKWIPFFSLAFFVINILLVLHIIPVPRGNITADRYMYLSIVGLSSWTVWQGNSWYVHWKSKNRAGQRIISQLIPLLILIYIGGFIAHSNMISRKWKDSETLKMDVKNHLYYMTAQEMEEDGE